MRTHSWHREFSGRIKPLMPGKRQALESIDTAFGNGTVKNPGVAPQQRTRFAFFQSY